LSNQERKTEEWIGSKFLLLSLAMSRAQNGDAAPTAEENKMEATSIRVREHDKRGWHVIATFESVEWANGRQWHHQIISEAIQARCSRFRCWFLVGEW